MTVMQHYRMHNFKELADSDEIVSDEGI